MDAILDAPTASGQLIPMDGETQPDFAIRFHEEMADVLPETDERNAACFEAWRTHVGDEPEVAIARDSYAKSHVERRDIPIFEEHETPKGDRYDRKSLIAIINNVNHRIADTHNFAPISLGHTSDDPATGDPEVVGNAGAARLGMVGNKKPRWAIFHDEYHRKDKVRDLDTHRGRSVEVWKYPRMEDRFFYPIAALGSTAPRLDIPPAKYSRQDSEGAEVEVDRYMMAMPGGSNTFVPGQSSPRRDQYGCDGMDSTGNPDSEMVNRLMTAISNTAVWQYIVQMMEQDSGSGLGVPSPMSPQPPEISQDAVANAMGGMTQPQLNPALMQQGTPPAPQQSQLPMPPQMSGGFNSQGRNQQMVQPNQQQPAVSQYARSSALEEVNGRIEKLEEENKALRTQLEEERGHRVIAGRYSRLEKLAGEFDMDLESEVTRARSMSDEEFDTQCGVIKDRYRRHEEAVSDFSAMSGAGRQAELPAVASNPDQASSLGVKDVQEIEKYALRHGITDWDDARERYAAVKSERSAPVAG